MNWIEAKQVGGGDGFENKGDFALANLLSKISLPAGEITLSFEQQLIILPLGITNNRNNNPDLHYTLGLLFFKFCVQLLQYLWSIRNEALDSI